LNFSLQLKPYLLNKIQAEELCDEKLTPHFYMSFFSRFILCFSGCKVSSKDGKGDNMYYIDDQEIRRIISMSDIIETIEAYYLQAGEERSLLPERLFINDGKNSALLMPSFYENYYVAKLIGIAPDNVVMGKLH